MRLITCMDPGIGEPALMPYRFDPWLDECHAGASDSRSETAAIVSSEEIL